MAHLKTPRKRGHNAKPAITLSWPADGELEVVAGPAEEPVEVDVFVFGVRRQRRTDNNAVGRYLHDGDLHRRGQRDVVMQIFLKLGRRHDVNVRLSGRRAFA
jgi:hypothetical protein